MKKRKPKLFDRDTTTHLWSPAKALAMVKN